MTERPSDTWLDFNDARDQSPSKYDLPGKDELKARLLDNLEDTLFRLFPAGCVEKRTFKIGDIQGSGGESLVVELVGRKAGLWKDFATGDGGDIIDLFAAAHGLDTKHSFPDVMNQLCSWFGESIPNTNLPKRRKRKPATNDLGPYTAKYDYFDHAGKLIACVYRYDPLGRRKQFRPYNVRTGKYEALDPRPLYNIPATLKAESVILCEGEKCADALNNMGHCAVSAMGGANAPINKTDWSPLQGKDVLIWPDNDNAGKSYAQRVSLDLKKHGVRSVAMLLPPDDKPEKWDAADAAAEGFNVQAFLEKPVSGDHSFSPPKIKVRSVRDMLDDITPMPPDLIGPRILGAGDIGVIAGAPKVGKSDFIVSAAMHWAAGRPFLNMTVPRPLRVLYLQAEIGYYYLRERLRETNPELQEDPYVLDNLAVSDKFNLILNDEGIEEFARICLTIFKDGPPDILILDPLRNIFDGGKDGASENDNTAMIEFFRNRVLVLQERVSKEMAIILLHHTRKMQKKMFEEDPFQALSGASAIRGFYTAGIILHKPDEDLNELRIYYELRNGPPIKSQLVTKRHGRWIELDDADQRLANKKQGRKQDAERDRKTDTIIELIETQAQQNGTLFTIGGFAKLYEGKYSLNSSASIDRLIRSIAVKGFIKFRKDTSEFDLRNPKSNLGYMITENIRLRHDDDLSAVYPSHYLDVPDGAIMEVENPQVWVWPLEKEERK